MHLLAQGQPLMLLPDLAWHEPIPSADPADTARCDDASATAARIREGTKLAAVTVGAIAASPRGLAAAQPRTLVARGLHAGRAAEDAHELDGGRSAGTDGPVAATPACRTGCSSGPFPPVASATARFP